MTIPQNFFQISGIVVTILISITFISYTSKFIYGVKRMKNENAINEIYDPDHGINFTVICILAKNTYATKYAESPCQNKTLMQWYNPWLRNQLWRDFWNEIKAKRRLKLMKKLKIENKLTNKTEPIKLNETVEKMQSPPPPPVEKENTPILKIKEKSSEFLYSVVVGFLVISVLAACWEVFRDKVKRNDSTTGKSQDMQCSLAEFTMNRHLRRESKQQAASQLPRQSSLELTAKVTQNLVHQSSLDRTFPKLNSEAVECVNARRNSVPSYQSSNSHQRDQSSGRHVSFFPSPLNDGCKRQSVDVTGETHSEFKKKSRHFIRRH